VDIPIEAEVVCRMGSGGSGRTTNTVKGYEKIAETMQNRTVLTSLFGPKDG